MKKFLAKFKKKKEIQPPCRHLIRILEWGRNNTNSHCYDCDELLLLPDKPISVYLGEGEEYYEVLGVIFKEKQK